MIDPQSASVVKVLMNSGLEKDLLSPSPSPYYRLYVRVHSCPTPNEKHTDYPCTGNCKTELK